MRYSFCIPLAFIIVFSLVLTSCGSSPVPALPSTPTPPITPTPPGLTGTAFSPSPEPVAPPSTPVPFANEEPVSPQLAGSYTLNGTAPDGTVYSGKLTISLNPDYLTSSTRQAEYDLVWSRSKIGAGILITDARGTGFLATGFGGSACSAVFYSVYSFMDGELSTFALNGIRLEPGEYGLGSEIATPGTPRRYLEGDYDLIGSNAHGNEYKGTLSIAKNAATVWDLAWNVGLSTPGIGISLNKSLFAAAYGGTGCGVAVYQVMPDGSLHATWAAWGSDQVGDETATK